MCVFVFHVNEFFLVLIVGENSIGNNNYEQLAQLNSQIETKHIASLNPFCKGFELFFPQKYFSIYICKYKLYFQFESYIF